MALPEVSWLLVNAPDSWYGGFSWYGMPPDHGSGVVRSRLLLDKLFGEVLEQGFSAENIVLFGFSQGCLLTLEWGSRTDLPLAGCIGVSGYCYDPIAIGEEASQAAKSRRWLVTHGFEDEVLPYETTASQVELLRKAGLPIDFRSYSKGHTIDPDLMDIRNAMMQMLSIETEEGTAL